MKTQQIGDRFKTLAFPGATHDLSISEDELIRTLGNPQAVRRRR